MYFPSLRCLSVSRSGNFLLKTRFTANKAKTKSFRVSPNVNVAAVFCAFLFKRKKLIVSCFRVGRNFLQVLFHRTFHVILNKLEENASKVSANRIFFNSHRKIQFFPFLSHFSSYFPILPHFAVSLKWIFIKNYIFLLHMIQ